jgi:hypothetical protein
MDYFKIGKREIALHWLEAVIRVASRVKLEVKKS